MTYDAVDLFAGPGGWDVGARSLGLTTLGIEFDHAACETRRAAGLPTIEDDVRDHGPAEFAGTPGFIASPPCQTFSMAGKGAGRAALDTVLLAIKQMAARETDVENRAIQWSGDERTGLVLEPLRWALDAVDIDVPFRWLAFEQVPTVLPVWEAMAEVLRAEGYSVATGLLHAEQFGVPQTRKRAILVARLDGEANLPKPTHSRYYPRNKTRMDPGVLPWVSMAQALGLESGVIRYSAKMNANDWQLATGTRPNAVSRTLDEPSTALAFGHDVASYVWVPRGASPDAVVGHKANGTSMRITVEEAALFQSFPVGHPWSGAKTKQYQQIGNAIPCALAAAILSGIAR